MTLAFISHPDCTLPELGDHHPESPRRLSAIEDQLLASGLEFALRRYDAPLASREQLCRAHAASYVEEIFSTAPAEGSVWLDTSTSMVQHSLTAALRAAGAVVLGVDLALTGQTRAAFCSVRPPGHHAEYDQAMGFCLFNNVAIGAAHALHTHALKRVAILDFDAHHGNGIESIFSDNPGVLYCSTFQHPCFPHRDNGQGSANVIAVPLPAESTGTEFRMAVEDRWLPALEQFRPELILISAGFDAHIEDDMADLCLRESDFTWVTGFIYDCAERHAAGRIVSVLEGGYALPALGRSVAAHLNALLG